MKLLIDGDEFFGAAVLFRNSRKAVSSNLVRCLGQINISRVEVSILFLTLLLQLTPSQQSYVPYGNHIDSPVRVHFRDGY